MWNGKPYTKLEEATIPISLQHSWQIKWRSWSRALVRWVTDKQGSFLASFTLEQNQEASGWARKCSTLVLSWCHACAYTCVCVYEVIAEKQLLALPCTEHTGFKKGTNTDSTGVTSYWQLMGCSGCGLKVLLYKNFYSQTSPLIVSLC